MYLPFRVPFFRRGFHCTSLAIAFGAYVIGDTSGLPSINDVYASQGNSRSDQRHLRRETTRDRAHPCHEASSRVRHAIAQRTARGDVEYNSCENDKQSMIVCTNVAVGGRWRATWVSRRPARRPARPGGKTPGCAFRRCPAALEPCDRIDPVLITHDLAFAWALADWVASMYLGKLVELGSAQTVLTEPLHPYTKSLQATGGVRTTLSASGSCALNASSLRLPIPRRERRTTRVVGETRSSGSVGVHQVDILIGINNACIRLREGYLLAIRRPGGFVFYDGLGTGEVGLAGAVSIDHIDIELPTVMYCCESHFLAIG